MNVAAIMDRLDPNQYVKFRSNLHNEKNAAVLGASLGICFIVCFATGMVSHIMQNPPSWYAWPSRPAGFYRFTQGLHVATGIASIPLLLAKLWTVFPKLLDWPPVNSAAQFLERVSLPPLIGGAFFQLVSGVANIGPMVFLQILFHLRSLRRFLDHHRCIDCSHRSQMDNHAFAIVVAQGCRR